MSNLPAYNSQPNWTPWVQERYKPSRDTRVCLATNDYQVREHVEGTEMFPHWLGALQEETT
jgi:hypothetical protein